MSLFKHIVKKDTISDELTGGTVTFALGATIKVEVDPQYNCVNIVTGKATWFDPIDLRQAAKMFNQIADALERTDEQDTLFFALDYTNNDNNETIH